MCVPLAFKEKSSFEKYALLQKGLSQVIEYLQFVCQSEHLIKLLIIDHWGYLAMQV